MATYAQETSSSTRTDRSTSYACSCNSVTDKYVIDHGNECSCNNEGFLPRTPVDVASGPLVQLAQLSSLITAAKYELKIRGMTSASNKISSRPTLDKLTIDDVNQMIEQIDSMRSVVPVVSQKQSVLNTDLTAMRNALRSLQAECVAYVACNCNYCYCHAQCSCNCYRIYDSIYCSCNTVVTCSSVCYCNLECSCNQVCTCNCNYCGCHYKTSKNTTRNCPSHKGGQL